MSQPSSVSNAAGIDPRGPRFNAAVTFAVLALVLVFAPAKPALALLALQALLFAHGAVLGIQHTPYAWVFRTVVRPRLAPPAELEEPNPPRFAQAVGLVFALVGLAGYLTGSELVGAVAVGFAVAAALLNAAVGFCLGCEMYLLLRRLGGRSAATIH